MIKRLLKTAKALIRNHYVVALNIATHDEHTHNI
jgi:hypothetical protein